MLTVKFDSWGPSAGIRFVTQWHTREVEMFVTTPISIVFGRESLVFPCFAGIGVVLLGRHMDWIHVVEG